MELEIQRELDDPGLPADDQILSWARQALGEDHAVMLNIRVVDLAEGWALNRQWRGKDSPTNVLSFPADAPDVDGLRVLGDVVLCAPVIQREAGEQGKELVAHWAHLVVHGVLHLLGFDHTDGPAADAMEAREVQILAALGFGNPYEVSDEA
ncbi:MAG: rRNA maturation RNase YbeY [Wenzhouxiangella sp.]